MSEDNIVGYRTNSGKVFYTPHSSYSCPEWFESRKSRRHSDKYRGVPDGHGGNPIYEEKVDGISVRSGYSPYSCPEWFDDARRQGVDRYDDDDDF